MTTASQLQDRIATTLARKIGGTQRRWRLLVGPIKLYDRTTHPHCNWTARPSGGAGEVAAIERLLDTLRLEVPIVEEG
ncbi:hypothetical protein DMC47_23785 [Nostoc sp. 3335mG]|nr:hypothetical protein DMC47_23785 [Nostoc sp. 3335mG]